ncbi:MAG: hypothetical protein ACT4QG_22100 [Sporichthyaceae bacterium]
MDPAASASIPSPVSTTVSTPTPSPTPTAEDDRAAVLNAYREFFNRQVEISNADLEQWRSMLEPFTAEPALSRALQGLKVAADRGRVGYGESVLNPRVVSMLREEFAAVEDCQDNSRIGEMIAATGQKKTRGVKRAYAMVTLQKGEDGAWRVTNVEYPERPCPAR